MKSLKKMNFYEWVFLIVLILYPLRHANIGLDYWDTGYSYTNFVYGFEHMDPMWFFSTYLANVIGHFFSMLPFGNTLVGLNVYTSLVISLMAVISYFFLRDTLQIPSVLSFLGLFLTINLCWCPTAVLYNYLTYLFMLLCTIFLYKGLSAHQNRYLFLAGVSLGANLFVRFSNAAEVAFIVGVWAYCFIEALDNKKTFWKILWNHIYRTTLWCLAGYVTSLVVFMGYISIRYGLSTYIEAISRLFGMTSESPGYSPKSMLLSIYYNYRLSLTWLPYLLGAAFASWMICQLLNIWKERTQTQSVSIVIGSLQAALVAIASGISVYLLYQKGMFSTDYHNYDSMGQPAIVLLIVVMVMAIWKIFYPGVSKEEKLVSGLIVLVNFISSIGSNTGIFPSINNTFILMTYFIWQLYKLFRDCKTLTIKKVRLHLTPLWLFLSLYLCFVAYQSIGFGSTFVFAEATGIKEARVSVEGNEVLKGAVVPADRAQVMSELTAYVKEHQLKNRQSITYWGLPALSFYLEMPPAFNAWCDLSSYQYVFMEQDLNQLRAEILTSPEDRQVYPVIITTTFMVTYEGELANTLEVAKWLMLKDFMEEFGYQIAFQNEKFTLYDIP